MHMPKRFRGHGVRCVTGFLFTVFLTLSAGAIADTPVGVHTPAALVAEMQKGGLILYVRHAATDHSQADKDLTDLSRCDLQRNLSTQGKEESHLLAQTLQRLNIKIGKVLTSPYCRCVDTEKIAFDHYEIVRDLRATFFTNEAETKELSAYLRRQLSEVPEGGKNTVLVGHTANLREVTKVWPKPEGVMHVFRPLGEGKGFKHLGRLPPSQWGEL